MQRRVKWQRVTTLASLIVAALFFLVFLETLLGASAAAAISLLPLVALLAVGLPISIVGLWLTVKLGPHIRHRRGFVINGAAIALYIATVIFVLSSVL